jgi:hypothetical protein
MSHSSRSTGCSGGWTRGARRPAGARLGQVDVSGRVRAPGLIVIGCARVTAGSTAGSVLACMRHLASMPGPEGTGRIRPPRVRPLLDLTIENDFARTA